MNGRVLSFLVILVISISVMTTSCGGGGGASKFMLTVYRGDKILLTSAFSCKDLNNDGTIDLNELVGLKEVENYDVSESSSNTGWRDFVDVSNMPMLDHGLEDVRAFKFNIAEFSKGKIFFEYKTYTKRDFKFDKYYFWRIVEIKNDGEYISFLHGIGDGTQGLALAMLDAKTLTMKITRQ